MKLFLPMILGALLATTPALGDQISQADVDSMEACLAEAQPIGSAGHCTGLLSDACLQSGSGNALTCARTETAVWQHILAEHWPYRCGICKHATLSISMRRQQISTTQGCAGSALVQERCLMSETARQAAHVFEVTR